MNESTYDPTTGKYSQRAVSENGTSWTANAISSVLADWDLNAGTWASLAGVLSQTDATADCFINLKAPLRTLQAVMQTDVRFPSEQDSMTTGLVAVAVHNLDTVSAGGTNSGALVGEGVVLLADAAGDGATYGLDEWLDGSYGGAPFPTAIAQDEWHTLRVVTDPFTRIMYLDDVCIGVSVHASGGNNFDGTTSPVKSADLFGIAAVGLVDFRNITVWTQTFPV